MALADIAGIAMAGDRQIRILGAKPDDGCCLRLHIGEQCPQRAAIQIVKPDILAPYNLIGHRCQEEPYGRSDTGVGRHDDPVNSKLCGQPSGMKRGAATKGNHRSTFKVQPALRRMDPRRAGHVFIDNLDHAARRIHRVQRQPVANMARQRLIRRPCIQRHGAAGKPGRVEPAKSKVGIGHRRVTATTRVAGRPGI